MRQELHSQLNNLMVFRSLFSLAQIAGYLRGFPVTINMLITSCCNLRCEICSAKGLMKDERELTSGQIIDFIKKIAVFKPALFFGGGEPFARKDIFEILKAVKAHRLKYGIVTNGTLLDSYAIDRLMETEPQIIIFSVYGEEAMHDAITGHSGAFKKLFDAVRYVIAQRKKTYVLLNSVINEKNYKDAEKIVRLGKRLGVDRIRFEQLIFLTHDEYSRHKRECVDKGFSQGSNLATYLKEMDNEDIGKELVGIFRGLRRRYGSFVIFKPHLSSDELSAWYKNNFLFKRKCMFIKHSVFVMPNGDITPCQFFPDCVLGNVTTDGLLQVWKGEKRRVFNSIIGKELLPGCMRCCKL
ncbi:MAG: radical SAM protein [Candidatus Omnitrophica bacterium]|nr:radical SAM protein [Candidatus Omnitrophota bacterium]MBU4478035.1 radical SAM protein [Candidatus Omnitrophota bacterium]MCG2703643.1 radical SAM protein [Candidatus Omnitrophota bacterium]